MLEPHISVFAYRLTDVSLTYSDSNISQRLSTAYNIMFTIETELLVREMYNVLLKCYYFYE